MFVLDWLNEHAGLWELLAAVATFTAVLVALLQSRSARKDAAEARLDAEKARQAEHRLAELGARAQLGAVLSVIPAPPFRGDSAGGTVGFRVVNLGRGVATHLEARVVTKKCEVAPMRPPPSFLAGSAIADQDDGAERFDFLFRLGPDAVLREEPEGPWRPDGTFRLAYRDSLGIGPPIELPMDPRPVRRFSERARLRLNTRSGQVGDFLAIRLEIEPNDDTEAASIAWPGIRLVVPLSWGDPLPAGKDGRAIQGETWWRREYVRAEFAEYTSERMLSRLPHEPLAVWERSIESWPIESEKHTVFFPLHTVEPGLVSLLAVADDGLGRAFVSWASITLRLDGQM